MKEKIFKLLGVFLVVLTIFVGIKAYNEFKSGKYIGLDSDIKNTITVSAKGEIFVIPDIAKFSVSADKKADTAVEAQDLAAEAINKIMAFLRDSGVDEKDIKTTAYNIYPKYDYIRDKGRVFRGYEARQTIEIKIRKIADAGKILSGSVQAGADNVGEISFTLDDEDNAKREARQKAVAKAKEKAERLSDDLGVELVQLVSFSESGGRIPVYRPFKAGNFQEDMIAIPEVPMGGNKISVTVNLTYQIK